MPALVASILVFVAVAIAFVAGNLLLGRLVRPRKPSPEKGEVYECGEEPIGSAWIQFDLRFYVVALLFVIFDVELAFFFPWAVVFGSANRAADQNIPEQQRVEAARAIQPAGEPVGTPGVHTPGSPKPEIDPGAMHQLAWVAFADILVFFGVLLVGFAYLWRRGDLDWVRSTAAQEPQGVRGEG
jgi:NADH-quinone oxidoreductase subunit A